MGGAVEEVVGGGSFPPSGELIADTSDGFGARESVAALQASDLAGAIGGDHDDYVHTRVDSLLRTRGDIVDDDRFWDWASGFLSSSGLLSCHARMNDLFQAPVVGMPEDQRAQRLPVQRPIRVQHRGAERPDDLAPGRFARLDDPMGQGIGIDNDCPQRANMCATVLLPVATRRSGLPKSWGVKIARGGFRNEASIDFSLVPAV